MSDKVRVTVDLNPAAYERLEAIEKIAQADSKAEVIRDALRLYEWVAKQIAGGATVELIDKDGKRETVVLLK